MSAWSPAPPPESEPAMIRTRPSDIMAPDSPPARDLHRGIRLGPRTEGSQAGAWPAPGIAIEWRLRPPSKAARRGVSLVGPGFRRRHQAFRGLHGRRQPEL